MSEKRKIEERIRKKELEIQELESKVAEAKVYLQALTDVLKLFPKEPNTSNAGAVAALRPGSAVALAREIILKKGAPIHITDLLRGLGKEFTRENRASLASSLAAYVRRREIFTRPAPNLFGLVEFGDDANSQPSVSRSPPDDFGDIDPEEVEIPT